MKILLFGITGCFGTEFESVCCDEDIQLVGLSHEEVEITDGDACVHEIDAHSPDVVINSVAIPGIDPCEENPDMAFAIHATAALTLAKACDAREAVYVQTSTHAVFDGRAETPYRESDIPNPCNVYAASKLSGEYFALNVCRKHYVVRFPTLFGARRNRSPGFADKVVSWLEEGRELSISDDKIDTPTYARDAAAGLLNILRAEEPYGVYHLANTGVDSYYDFACVIRELVGAPNKIHRAKEADFPAKGIKPKYSALVTERLQPMRPWRDALAEFIGSDARD